MYFVFSPHGVYFYIYKLLPSWDIILFSKSIEINNTRFNTKANTANIIFIFIAVIDYLFWDKMILNLRMVDMDKRSKAFSNSFQLSVHFIKSLLEIARRKNNDNNKEIYSFFHYVISNMSRRRIYVSLEEEWKNVKVLSAVFAHKTFVLKGEELLSEGDWNRSVPAFGLLTWMENAIFYSPTNCKLPIEVCWSKRKDHLQLTISNVILESAINYVSTGEGLALVNSVFFESHYSVQYEINSDNKFVVILTLK